MSGASGNMYEAYRVREKDWIAITGAWPNNLKAIAKMVDQRRQGHPQQGS